MRLFSRQPAAAAIPPDAAWQPDGSGAAVAAGSEMDDEGCAGTSAYGVTFTLEGAGDSAITAWFYATFAGADMSGGFQVGWRCEYSRAGGVLRPPWVHVAYGMDDPEFYSDLDHAEATARWMAETLASTPRTGPSDDDPSFFDWDGRPW